MHKIAHLLLAWLAGAFLATAADVLIVADEFPAMEVLATQLKTEEKLSSQIIKQTEIPSDIAAHKAVVVYIHKQLSAAAEKAFLDYALQGGKLVNLHHSISSGKRTNANWFAQMGITLATGDVDKGGYKWVEGVTLDIVNLNTNHFITTHKVPYAARFPFPAPTGDATLSLPGFTLHESEVYLNHQLKGERTLLLGLRYKDAKTGKQWEQGHAGWYRPTGKGWIYYFLPGHSIREFQDPAYARLVINAIIHKP
jgi:hypothetical protein